MAWRPRDGESYPMQRKNIVRSFWLDERFFSHVKNVVRSSDWPELISERKFMTAF